MRLPWMEVLPQTCAYACHNSPRKSQQLQEKSNPDRIETCLKLERNIKDTTETTTESPTDTTETTTETPADTTETILKIIRNNSQPYHYPPY